MMRDEEIECPKCGATSKADVETLSDDDEGAEFFCHACQHLWDVLWD